MKYIFLPMDILNKRLLQKDGLLFMYYMCSINKLQPC